MLGAILLDPASLASVFPILKEDDFFPDTHRRIYRSMTELAQRSAEIDVLTLREELSRTGAVDKAGGATYLSSLLDGVPDVANVEHYARIVKEKSTLRRLIRAGQRMVREGLAQEKDAQNLLGDVTGEIFDIAEDAVSGGFERIGRDHPPHPGRHRGGQGDGADAVSGLATGFLELDRMTSGLQDDRPHHPRGAAGGREDLARPEHRAARRRFREGRSVGFFSLEMSKEQIGFRVLCSEADVDAKKVRDGYASERGDHAARDRAVEGGRRTVLRGRRLGPLGSGDAREGAAPEARARPRPAGRRLPPADDGTRPVRQPHAGGLADLPRAEAPREGAAGPDHRPLPALAAAGAPQRRAAQARSSRTCANADRWSRTPTSSSFSTARSSTTRTPNARGSPTSSSPSSATAPRETSRSSSSRTT